MSHAKNKVEWCLRKAEKELKESDTHRGLAKAKPSIEAAVSHIAKAEHYLKATAYLKKGGFSDVSASTSFYAMYHSLLAIAVKFGYESRNQECTFATVEHLIKNKKVDLDIKWLRKMASFEENLDEETIIALREEFQYGTEAVVDDAKMNELINNTREFIEIVKVALKK